jgi:thiol-disulfide isomerase/thioredoxin
MSRAWNRLAAFGSSLVVAASAVAAEPPLAPPAGGMTTNAAANSSEQQVQSLLQQLTDLSKQIEAHRDSPQIWRHQFSQAEVMLQLASRTKDKERETWLKMAIDGHYSAAIQSPANETVARQRLAQLPNLIRQFFPASRLQAYAAYQEIQADYFQAQAKAGDNPSRAQEHLRDRLLQFAKEYLRTPEAAKAVEEVAQMSEMMGKKEDARLCYHHLVKFYPGTPMARKARGSEWRLGGIGHPIDLKLDYLFASGLRDIQKYDLESARGKVVLLYFWSSTCGKCDEDFQILKQLTDRHQFRGLEIVYINLDKEEEKAKAYLTGRLTAGAHVHQPGAMESDIAERFGIRTLPEAFIVDREGKLLRHSLQAAQAAEEIGKLFPAAK